METVTFESPDTADTDYIRFDQEYVLIHQMTVEVITDKDIVMPTEVCLGIDMATESEDEMEYQKIVFLSDLLFPGIYFPTPTSMVVDFTQYMGHPLPMTSDCRLEVSYNEYLITPIKLVTTTLVEYLDHDEFITQTNVMPKDQDRYCFELIPSSNWYKRRYRIPMSMTNIFILSENEVDAWEALEFKTNYLVRLIGTTTHRIKGRYCYWLRVQVDEPDKVTLSVAEDSVFDIVMYD